MGLPSAGVVVVSMAIWGHRFLLAHSLCLCLCLCLGLGLGLGLCLCPCLC